MTKQSAESVVFECPRCQARSSFWKMAMPFAQMGKKDSSAQCQACHQRLRLDHVSYPMVMVATEMRPAW